MNSDHSHDLARLLDGYRDGTLDQRDAQRLAALLDDPALAARAMASLADDGLIGMALASEGQAQAAWRKRLALDAEAAAFRHDFDVRRSSTETPAHRGAPRRPLWHRLAAAALILVAIGVAAWSSSGPWLPAPGARLEFADAGTVLWQAGQARQGERGTVLRIGECVEQRGGGAAGIRFSDGTRLEVRAGALMLEKLDAGKRLRLERGRLEAQVAPQTAGQPLIIATADTETVVVGTAFTLETDPVTSTTRLVVEHGLVRLASHRSGQQVEVAAGQTAEVAHGGALAVHPSAAPPAEVQGNAQVNAFLDTHCSACHGAKKQKGDVRFDTLSRDFSVAGVSAVWADVMEQINSGEMPPKKEARPKPNESAAVVEWIAGQLKAGEVARLNAEGPVAFHRLTREEYANTIRDLLGVTYDATDPTGLPMDASWQGFERIGSVLGLSATHIEKYLLAGKTVLDEALPETPLAIAKDIWAPISLRNGPEGFANGGLDDHVRIDVLPGNSLAYPPNRGYGWEVKQTGEYRMRIKLSGIKPDGGPPPRLRVKAIQLDRILYEGDVLAPEDQPIVLEIPCHLPAGWHNIDFINAIPGPSILYNSSYHFELRIPFTDTRHRQPWQVKLTDDQGKILEPVLLVDYVEVEGPIRDLKPVERYLKLFAGEKKDLSVAREILSDFAQRAFRRPATSAELERMVALVEAQLKAGDGFQTAVKAGMLAIMCSKDFLFLVEGSARPAPAGDARQLTDLELASRLSYFLWSTMPDEHLLNLARSETLHQPPILSAEVARLLSDAKAQRLAPSFTRQWLQLRRVGMFPPDKKLYPDYDDHLQQSMVGEPSAYFNEMLAKNLSLREFIVSDWTMLNARLATHYEIAGVAGDEFRRVALTPANHRGGLLTMAAILSLTSDGSRHRPVHRGKWVLESIVGRPPPPPPANVKPIEPLPPGSKKLSLREKLASHTMDAACAGCHRKIDPLGLAFDHYDAVGHWRTVETVTDGAGDNPAVDASGVLPDGRAFSDAEELKRLLADNLDALAVAFTEKLATFATRRVMTATDRLALSKVVAACKAKGYPLCDVIVAFILSDVFQSR